MKHYYRKDSGFEARDVIRSWNLSFSTGNTLKYICRAGLKNSETADIDLEKARSYLKYELEDLERAPQKSIEASDLSQAWELDLSYIETLSLIKEYHLLKEQGDFTQAKQALTEALVILDRKIKENR